jgi:hypothetical protein
VSGVDWSALEKMSGRIRRHVARRLAVGKAPGRPVLAGAFKKFNEGFELKYAVDHPAVYHAIALSKPGPPDCG